MIGLRLTRDVLNEFSDGGVIGQRAAGRLHVRQLRDKLLDLPNCFCVVSFLSETENQLIHDNKLLLQLSD